MSEYSTSHIRNIALVGHAGSGKTSLVEALLEKAGVIHSKGSVIKGTTVSDFDPLEKSHQHSLSSSIISFEHKDHHINLIDTPGYPDFIGSALSVLPAVETVAVVINAENGIESMTRRMMAWAEKHNFCRIIIVNHIDADGVNLDALLKTIQEEFGSECLALNLPAKSGDRVVDCFFNPSGESAFSSVEEAHTALVDQTVEVDEELMTLYLEQGEISPEQLHDPFEQALREGHLVPVCFASAESGVGVNTLLSDLVKLMPNPTEANPPKFINGYGDEAEEVAVSADPGKHVLAHIMQIKYDPFIGKIGVFRVHQGTVNKDSQLFIGDARKAFKVGHMFSLFGKDHNEQQAAVPGDICAVTKIDGLNLDAVLHDSHDEDLIHLEPADLPKPMVGLAVEPKSRGDEQKVSDVLHRLIEEDPCLRLERNPSANETILRGLGDLHLRIALESMESNYHVEVNTHTPTIPYRETIRRKAEGHCRHKKQTGGAGQFGEVYLRVEPLGRGSGFQFDNEVVGGAIPAQFIPAVEKGVLQVLENGAVAGYPIEDIKVTVYDGKHHSVDSKEIAFVSAGKKAFVDAINKAQPIVLEPIVSVEVTAPNACMGDITGDLSSRRGRVSQTDSLPGDMTVISALVPLAEMEDYQSRLKSITGGEGNYVLELSSYEATTAEIQKKLIASFVNPEED